MTQESVYANGEELRAVRATARKHNVMVSIGISEKVHSSIATLYNSNMIIGSQGEVLVHHRKLVPTFFEKLTWSPGDGHGLRVADTSFGKIGNLICGENTNPLTRYALMAQGENVHISTWPAIWPTRSQPTPTAGGSAPERQDGNNAQSTVAHKNYDNVAANRTRAAAHCFEAKCFGVLCAGVLGDDAIAEIAVGSSRLKAILEQSQRGASMFLDPTGAHLPGFTVDDRTGKHETTDYLQNTEGILYADVNVEDCIEGKQYHDVVGGYQRMDVFDLAVDRTRRYPVRFSERVQPEPANEEGKATGGSEEDGEL